MQHTREEMGKQLLYDLTKGRVKEAFDDISQGARIDLIDGWGASALNLAATYSYPELVQALISEGADIEQKDIAGSTPLMSAAYAGCADAVEKLVAAGADVEAVDNDNHCAAELAKSKGHLLLANRLFDLKALRHARDMEAWNDVPMHVDHEVAISKPLRLKLRPSFIRM